MKVKEKISTVFDVLRYGSISTLAQILDQGDDLDFSEIETVSPLASQEEQIEQFLHSSIEIFNKDYETLYFPKVEELTYNENGSQFFHYSKEQMVQLFMTKKRSSNRCRYCMHYYGSDDYDTRDECNASNCHSGILAYLERDFYLHMMEHDNPLEF